VSGALVDEHDPPSSRAVLAVVAGMVGLHVWLTALQAVGLRWTPWTILAVAATVVVGRRVLPAAPRPLREPGFAWSDAVALAVVLAFAVAAVRTWIVFPDFIYHWGVKGQRFALAGGIDWEFLGRRANWAVHPDYPNLMPELFAVTAILGGGFREPAALAWSALLFALLLAAARAGLLRGEASARARRAGLAFLATVVGAFAFAGLLAGSSDWCMALAPLLAWPALRGEPSARSDARLGLAAAFAAASKMEGVPLALLLVGVGLARRWWLARRLDWRTVARGAAAPAMVILVWWWQCKTHHLFQAFNTGALDLGRIAVVGPALVEVLRSSAWHGGQLVLLALPLLLAVRGARAVALVAAGQLAFYLYIYLSAPIDPVFSVRSTFPRFILHVAPALWVAAIAVSERLVRRHESCDPSAP
jgi:hypothetical protein